MYKIIIFCCASLLFASCGTGLYSPINETPITLRKKGDLNAACAVNHGNTAKLQLGAAYSPVKHIGIACNGVYGKDQKSLSLALGLYKNTDLGNDLNRTIAIYTGINIGEASHSRHEGIFSTISSIEAPNKINGRFKKYFTNVSANYKKKNYNMDISARLITLDFDKLTISAENPKVFYEVEKIVNNNPAVLFELGYKYEFNFDKLNAFMGINQKFDLISDLPYYESTTIYTGINLDLNKLLKSKL